jgi:hypothetical protein
MSLLNRFNNETHDGLVLLCADPARGIWSNQVATKVALRAIRTAGTLSTCASAHTLLTVALVNALRCIARKDAQKLTWNLPRTVTKPRLLVISNDNTFLDALSDFNLEAERCVRLKAGQNFADLLRSQIVRFDLTYQTETENIANLVLSDWAGKHVIAPTLLSGFPKSLLPSAISFTV